VKDNPTRHRILDAAAATMRERGFARATTRHVAQQAGVSEALLYKYFADRTDMMLAVLRERTTAFTELAAAVADHSGSLEDGLVRIARAAVGLYTGNFPMLASIFSDTEMFARHRDALQSRGGGPQHVNLMIEGWLVEERSAGRIAAGADTYAGAALLAGSCMQHAFLGHMGWAARRSDEEAARSFARSALAALLAP
jgi:AcrR family transcriptional regulator